MYNEHDLIVLTTDLPDKGLITGDVGTIIHIHRNGEAFEVEFLSLEGDTVAITTVLESQARGVSNRDITHARQMESRV